eukprot:6207545-Pleurochrysis_carterae.AAC.2
MPLAHCKQALDYFNNFGGGSTSNGGVSVFPYYLPMPAGINDEVYIPGTVPRVVTTAREDRRLNSNDADVLLVLDEDAITTAIAGLGGVSSNALRTSSYQILSKDVYGEKGDSVACAILSGVLSLLMSYDPGQPRERSVDWHWSGSEEEREPEKGRNEDKWRSKGGTARKRGIANM